jgi:hypothetical protein
MKNLHRFTSTPKGHIHIYYRWFILSLICFDITDVMLPNPLYTIIDMFWHHWRHVTKPTIYYRWYVLLEIDFTSHLTSSLICFTRMDFSSLRCEMRCEIYFEQNISTIVYGGFGNVTSVMSKHINDSIWGLGTSLTSRYQAHHILSLICFARNRFLIASHISGFKNPFS